LETAIYGKRGQAYTFNKLGAFSKQHTVLAD